jgi:hypothetical protein
MASAKGSIDAIDANAPAETNQREPKDDLLQNLPEDVVRAIECMERTRRVKRLVSPVPPQQHAYERVF